MQTIFKGNGPVFEAANRAFCVLFEGAGVSKMLSRTRHLLIDEYEFSPENAAKIVNMVRNLIYDPMAAHGVKPDSDPTVKKYMDKFQVITEYVINRIIGYLGVTDKAAQRIAYLGEELRKFLKDRPGAEITRELVQRLDRAAASHFGANRTHAVQEKVGDYDAIPISSSNELKQVLAKIGADEVHWCIRSDDYWNHYSNHNKNSFYILYNSKLPASDPMSVIGTFVSPFNRVAYSFDRPNHSVNLDTTAELLANAGIDMTPPDDDERLAALNDNMYDLDDVFPDYKCLKPDVYLVKSEDGKKGTVIVEDGDYFRKLFPDWVDINRIGTIEDRRFTQCVTDGHAIYSLYEPFEQKGEVPEDLTITTDRASADSSIIVFVKRGDRIVNIFDCSVGELLLDPASDIEFNDAQFYFADWDRINQCYKDCASTEMGPNNYWILSNNSPTEAGRHIQDTPDIVYVVDKRGKNLADCPRAEIPAGYSLRCISKDGRYYAFEKYIWHDYSSHHKDVYLVIDGKVCPNPFREIEPGTDVGIWTLYRGTDSDAPYYELDVNTGELEEKKS